MITFLYGEDEFRSNRKLAEIKNRFLDKNKEGGALFVFDFSEGDANIEEALPQLSSGGLFSNKKLAIFKNTLQNKSMPENENLLKLLKRIHKDEMKDLEAVFWEKEKFGRSAKLAKLLLANGKQEEFKFLEGTKLLNWIKEETKKKSGGDVSIANDAGQKLASFVGAEDLYLLDREMEKLVSYKGKGEIQSADIDLLVRSKISADIFRTIDALAGGDKKTAMKLLHDHLSAGDDPFYILSMYFYQFRNLLKVKPLADRRVADHEIAAKLKLHPFVVKKSVAQGRNFSLKRLKEIYKSLCDADFRIKTGKIGIELALDRFVAMV